uniref:Endonuclease/exonuclease/phosphatase domain-containing protein n=2 Tax=Lotharella globosa TaxID=91324 RepID=A0A7S3ZI66_9EUKA|mmetsp:Transcript_13688/g.25985  ORF Transcript_13688/g.25985 Transcript_13688/m.25985 type:complete len:294 (+) Transcript_13688:1-882(+)
MGVVLAFPSNYEMKDCYFHRPSRVRVDYNKRDIAKAASAASESRALMGVAAAICTTAGFSFSTGRLQGLNAAVAGLCALGAAVGTYFVASALKKRTYPAKSMETKLRDCPNVMLMTKLFCKTTKQEFWVANYHMPCKFWDNDLMAALAVLAREKALRVARKDPVVFAGDFNATPGSAAYQCFTSNEKPEGIGVFSFKGAPIFPLKTSPFSSALAKGSEDGKEPSFTNFARREFRGKEIEFCDCIDYIFISDHWEVKQTSETPNKETTMREVGSYPTDAQPSDHLPISAVLALN